MNIDEKSKTHQVRLEHYPSINEISQKRKRTKIYDGYALSTGPLPPPPPTPPYNNLASDDNNDLLSPQSPSHDWPICDIIIKNNECSATNGNDFYDITHEPPLKQSVVLDNHDPPNCTTEERKLRNEKSEKGSVMSSDLTSEKNKNSEAQQISLTESNNADNGIHVMLDDYIQINRGQKVLERPTSLFKPGEPKIFSARGTANLNFGAMEKLAEQHYSSQKMTSQSMTSGYQKARRKRRPLPPIPKHEGKIVSRRDVGVMTPEAGRINYCASPVTPQAPSTYNSSIDQNWISDKCSKKKNRKYIGKKTKLFLLLIPSFIAITTTILLVLFLMGKIGSNKEYTEPVNQNKVPSLMATTAQQHFTTAFETSASTFKDDTKVTKQIETKQTEQQETTNLSTEIPDKNTTKIGPKIREKTQQNNKRKTKNTKPTLGRKEIFITPKIAAVTKDRNARITTLTTTRKAESTRPKKRKNRKRNRKKQNKKIQPDNRRTRHLGRSILVPQYSPDRENAYDYVTPMTSQLQENRNDDRARIFKPRDENSRSFDPHTSSIKSAGRLTKGANNDVINEARNDVISKTRSNVNRFIEYGSAYNDQDLSDDDYTDDVTYDVEAARQGQTCDVIVDPICDAVLPYKYTTSVTSSNMTSFGLIVEDLRKRSKQSNDCDVESMTRFVCALQYPQCSLKQDGTLQAHVVCKLWCVKVITNCFGKSSNQKTKTSQNTNFHQIKFIQDQAREKRHNHVTNRPGISENEMVLTFCQNLVLNQNEENCLDISNLEEFVETPKQGCGIGYFSCVNEQCIDNRWLCDGNNDCEDGEDEVNCVCEFGEYRCKSGQCIEQRRHCDGIEDCMDRSDERECESCAQNMTSCGRNGQCIPSAWWCDGDVDCEHGNDENNCTCASQGLHSCRNESKCFATEYICDGENDCKDGWDELNCQHNEHCQTWEFYCSGRCLSITKRCDGIVHCLNKEDENNCGECEKIELNSCTEMDYNVTILPNYLGHTSQSSIALSPEYVTITTMMYMRCHVMIKQLGCLVLAPPIGNHQSCGLLPGQQRTRLLPCRSFCEEVRASCSLALLSASLSWPRFLQCENFPEKSVGNPNSCFDSPRQDGCPADRFRCTTPNTDQELNTCISSTMRCDGMQHCMDGSDEIDCNCKALGRFECRSGNKCVLMNWVCDSHLDCDDGSDELNCDKCTKKEMACKDYSCIDKELWCNGNVNCKDGSDETNCIKLIPRGKLYMINKHQTSHQYQRGILIGFNDNSSDWEPVCADGWKGILSHLACNQMGFSEALTSTRLPQHQPHLYSTMKISGNKRIRKIQELFQQKSTHCTSNRILHIGCKTLKCGQKAIKNHVTTRILGGRISRQNTWPWLASLSLPGMKHVCGATLIKHQWLLSAAHCFQERKDVRLWKVELRGSRIEVFNATKIITHPRYDEMAVDFDIALIKLDRKVKKKSIHSPICSPTNTFKPGSYCVIAGWGVTGKTLRVSTKLQQGSVHVIKRQGCQQFYPNHVITDRMLCAGHSGLVDACSGDSGGPLMCWHPQQLSWHLAGVTSWGSSCQPHSAPGVYTNVKYFVKWIDLVVETN